MSWAIFIDKGNQNMGRIPNDTNKSLLTNNILDALPWLINSIIKIYALAKINPWGAILSFIILTLYQSNIQIWIK